MEAPDINWEIDDAPKLLRQAVEGGDELTILLELRKLVARELESNRCPKCQRSTMNEGQISSLVQRMVELNKAIDALKALDDDEDPLSVIQNRPRLASVSSITDAS